MPLDKSILKKKVFGLPVPVLALGGGVVGVIAYRKYAGKQGAADTGGDTAADYSGGTGSGSGAGSGAAGGSAGDGGITGGAFNGPPPIIRLRQRIINRRVVVKRGRKGANQVRRRPVIVNRIIVNPRYPKRRISRPPAVSHTPPHRGPVATKTGPPGPGAPPHK